MSCVLLSGNKTKHNHISLPSSFCVLHAVAHARECLCVFFSPTTLNIMAHHELPVQFKPLTRYRPHVGINTGTSNILLCNIVINYTCTYHKVTSLLGVTTSHMLCKATRGQSEDQDTIMELLSLFCSLHSLSLRQK